MLLSCVRLYKDLIATLYINSSNLGNHGLLGIQVKLISEHNTDQVFDIQ